MNRNEDISAMSRYARDLDLARRMTSESTHVRELAWAEFNSSYPDRILCAIGAYSRAFTDSEAERIRDRVMDRLLKNDFGALRKYEGRNCSLIGYLRKPIEWECIAEWRLKQRLSVESLDQAEEAGRQASGTWDPFLDMVRSSKQIPEPIRQLDGERRWVFLLRYHDNFEWGFPGSEVRAVAKARGVPIGEIGHRLAKIFEGDRVSAKKQQRKDGRAITTPYEAIGYILLVDNLNTLRSRFLEAKRKLAAHFTSHGHFVS